MAKYGDAAVYATKLYLSGNANLPDDAWTEAVKMIFPDSPSSQKKGCPKGAYLGLCEEGLVKGVPPINYTRSKKNKGYAVEAVRLLKCEPDLAKDENLLWFMVMKGEEKAHNSQMDVVITLWNHGLIEL